VDKALNFNFSELEVESKRLQALQCSDGRHFYKLLIIKYPAAIKNMRTIFIPAENLELRAINLTPTKADGSIKFVHV